MADDGFKGCMFGMEEVYPQYDISPLGDWTPGFFLPDTDAETDDGTHLTLEEEQDLMTKQVFDTQGFDIDFSQFRYRFNYAPVEFDKNEWPIEETTKELVDRLSRNSLERYNDDKKTSYEFVEVSKANYHSAGPGLMFFITFRGKDSSSDDDDQPKTFQAQVHYSVVNPETYYYYDLKPEKKVHPLETAEKEGAKKPRLTEESDACKH